MTKPKTTHFDTLSLHAGARPDPRRARGRRRSTQSASFVLPGHRPRRGALQHGARRARLFADLQSDVRGARGARSPRSKAAWARSRRRAARRRCTSRIVTPAGRGQPHRRVARALRRLAQPARLHAAALRRRDDVRRSARPRRVARGDPPETRAAASARRSAIRASTCSTSRAWPRSRTSTACRCSSTRRSRRRISCSRSRTAPISCSIRRPNSCPATAS